MKLARLPLLLSLSSLFVALTLSGCAQPEPETAQGPAVTVTYPATERVDHIDTYHGVEVADPYRWLEDLDGEETAQWVEAQNAVAQPFLEAIPSRDEINERLTEVWNYERFRLPDKEGGRYFYRRNDGLQDQDVLYVTDTLDGEARVLIDPNTFSDDRTASMSSFVVSPAGSLVAYALGATVNGDRPNFLQVIVPALLMGLMATPLITLLYGEEYRDAAEVIVWLLPGIVIIGYDAIPPARDAIMKGRALKADVVQYPFKIGQKTIETIVRLLDEMRRAGGATLSLKPALFEDYNQWMAGRFPRFSWGNPSCNSYYQTADGQVPFLFAGDFKRYVQLQADVGLHELSDLAELLPEGAAGVAHPGGGER